MHDRIRHLFAALEAAVDETSVTPERKAFISVWVVKLHDLYGQFRETNSSRFGDEITRLVQQILRELEACPEARKLDADFRAGLHELHEELGIPRVALKPAPVPPKPKSRKKAKS
jgi:hypothetical protein